MFFFNIFKYAQVKKSPFTYAAIPQFISTDVILKLLEEIPVHNNYRSTRAMGSDKHYSLINNVLLPLGAKECDPKSQLSSLWKDLVSALTGKDYLEAMSNLLSVDLFGSFQEITLKRYVKGDYISAHTDTANVRATHMIFLNPNWNKEWGGSLNFLTSNGEVLRSFVPCSECSAAFVRSDNSWHAVDCVTEDVERIALQVVFWNIDKKAILPGRRYEYLEY